MRRTIIDILTEERIKRYPEARIKKISPNNYPYIYKRLDERGNVINKKCMEFYKRHQVKDMRDGFELLVDCKNKVIMTTKHCLLFEFGWCHKYQNVEPYLHTLYLKDKRHIYHLRFDCQRCCMNIILER